MKYLFLAVFTVAFSAIYSQNSLDFDGSNDYVQTTLPSISGNAARTIEAWVRTTANANPSNGGSQKVIADMGTGATGSRFTLNILWSDAIRLEVAGSGLSGTIAVNDGLWHHVAGVYDPLAANNFSLYVDGVLDVAGNIATPVNTSATGNFRIGVRIDNANYFDGNIDEVRVWNVARTGAEIANNRNAEFCQLPAGLIAYYQFNQGNAGSANSGKNKLYDAVDANTGTLNGFSLSGTSSNWVGGASITGGLSTSLANQSTCDSISIPSDPTRYWTNSGLQRDTMTNSNSCDSLIFVNLTVNKSQNTTTIDSVCEAYTSPSGKYTYTTSGIYYDTTTTSKGCAHYHTLDLQINIIDTTVSVSGHQLTSNQASALHYIWLDCADDYSQISGSNNRVFNPTKDGEYAVRITNGKCIDTSNCITVVGVGLKDVEQANSALIYPNPTIESVNVQLTKSAQSVIITLLSISGQEIVKETYSNTKSAVLDLKNVPSGLYLIQITADGERWQERLIKK